MYPFCTKPSVLSDQCFSWRGIQACDNITGRARTCQDTVMASLPHAGVFSRKSVSLITLHGSNDTSFLTDKADNIKYIVLPCATVDDVIIA
jgi:hypothetical protein